jgi:hypothetical protein
MMAAQARFLRHRVLLAPLGLQGAVTNEIQGVILRRRKGLQGLLRKPPQQSLRAPVGGAQQTAVMLIPEMGPATPGQGLEVGTFPMKQVQDQQLTEHELVPVMKTRPEHPQGRRHAARQTGQGHGPGLLENTRSGGR